MTRTVIIEHDGRELIFALSRLDRRKLYGWKRRVGLDSEGRECIAGQLTQDGRWLLAPGSVAEMYMDENGDYIEQADLVVYDEEGNPLAKLPSTLDTPQPLGEPIPFAEYYDHIVMVVYTLEPEDADDIPFADGKPRRIPFRYRAGTNDHAAFIVKGEAGLFLVVAEPAGFDFIGFDEVVSELDDDGYDWWESDSGLEPW